MYAIFEAKGNQYRAEPNATLRLPTLSAQPGERVTFDQVLLAHQDDEIIVGRPSLEGASVAAEVVRHGRGDKVIVYKMKRRKGYRRKAGHRQGFTEVRVVDIDLGGETVPGKSEKKAAPKARKRAEPKAAQAAKVAPKPAAAEPAAEKRREPAAAGKAARSPAAEAAAAELPVTDSARALAEEANLDLTTVEGTGKGGRILKGDVEKAIKQRGEA